jgi:hypothetical protein
MHTLLLSSWSLPSARALASAARRSRWRVYSPEKTRTPTIDGRPIFYGWTGDARLVADRFRLALLEPPLDLLTNVPSDLLRRRVEFGQFGDVSELDRPTFLKPADPLNKAFDAGVYRSLEQLCTPVPIDPSTPVLIGEPVEWLAEYRCFLLEGRVAAVSPYLSFGRVAWRPYRRGEPPVGAPPEVEEICGRLSRTAPLPPAVVVDVGLIDDRGWAVVEFNPVWCSALLGADPACVLPVLARASQPAESIEPTDERWTLGR